MTLLHTLVISLLGYFSSLHNLVCLREHGKSDGMQEDIIEHLNTYFYLENKKTVKIY